MVARFKKKKHSRTYNYGSKKKNRGGGSRGGKGRAGSHKHHYIKRVVEEQMHINVKGFHSLKKKGKSLNISDLPDLREINLTKMGYFKLLGKGNIDKAITVKVFSVSKRAKEKIEKAGGSITGLVEKKTKKKGD